MAPKKNSPETNIDQGALFEEHIGSMAVGGYTEGDPKTGFFKPPAVPKLTPEEYADRSELIIETRRLASERSALEIFAGLNSSKSMRKEGQRFVADESGEIVPSENRKRIESEPATDKFPDSGLKGRLANSVKLTSYKREEAKMLFADSIGIETEWFKGSDKKGHIRAKDPRSEVDDELDAAYRAFERQYAGLEERDRKSGNSRVEVINQRMQDINRELGA
jgi:hypothetical protein